MNAGHRPAEPDWVGEPRSVEFDDLYFGKVKASEWYDARLKQAYALIDEVIDAYDLSNRSDVARQLVRAAEAVENADLALEIIA